MAVPVPLVLTPQTVNVQLYGGDENAFGVEVFSGGSPVDISGWTFQAQARSNVTDAAAAATATCTVSAGKVQVAWGDLRLLLGTSASWTGVWDLQATRPGATLPRTLIAGKLTVSLDVTREAT
jgi:hypothetical protein